jgi:riboflavin kinase/FMN adenylyltransferase
MKRTWYRGQIIQGEKLGQTLGFPTANLDPNIILPFINEGVYSALVRYKRKQYQGALFLGPKLISEKTVKVLEIHILNFNKKIYGEIIDICVLKFLRKVKNFSSLKDLKSQLQVDVDAIISVML